MKPPGRTLACLLVTLALALAAAAAAGAEERRITVVYTEWYPYTYEENGRARGFEIETVQGVLARMDIRGDFRRLPWKRCLKMLEEGRADALVSLLKTPGREAYTIFPPESVSVSKTKFFIRADRDIRYGGSFENLRGRTVGVIAGFSYGTAFDRAASLRKEEAKDAEALIRKVISGRNDLAAENLVVVRTLAEKMGVEKQIRFLNPPIHTQNLYVGFSRVRNLGKLAGDFSAALRKFKRTEEYRKILKKYGITPEDMRPDRPDGEKGESRP
jgi:polar amino acid transport system substrate-binding protein